MGLVKLSVLIACERSQVIANTFRKYGVAAYSCDLLPCYGGHPEYHIIDDAINVLYSNNWSLVIAHPPCTYFSRAGISRYYSDSKRYTRMLAAREFFLKFYDYPGRICIENPVPLKLAKLPPYDQLIQPYYFGEPYSKATCLWLKGLPPLMYTCICESYLPWIGHLGIGEANKLDINRQAARSKTFQGIADAMVKQWIRYTIGG